MLLYLEVVGLRTQTLAAREPELRGRPFVVLRGRRILDICAEAAGSGLEVGQELTPAALLDLGVLWRRDIGDAACAPLQEELLGRLSRFARSAMDCGIGCAAAELWHPEEAGAVIADCRGIGWQVRAAVDRSVRGAHSLVRGGSARQVTGGVLYGGPRAALPLSALEWLPAGAQRRLARLGLRTVGDLREVSAGELWQQVGEIGRTLWEFAQGREPQGYQPSAAPHELSWRRSYETAACTAQAEIARAVADGIEALCQRGGLPAIGAVEVMLQDDGGERVRRQRELLRPTRRRARLEAAGLGLALGIGAGRVREFYLRLHPSREEAQPTGERGLFYPPPPPKRRMPPAGAAVLELPARERRLAYFDPYRREAGTT